MSDNVAITPGAGATAATDNIGGVHYQRVKVAYGVDGAAVDASATNPFPVNVAAGNLALTGEAHMGQVGGAVSVITPTMTMDTTPDYSSGDVYGDKTTLTGAMRVSSGSGVLQSLVVASIDGLASPFDILIFDSDPTGNTFTDNTALPTLAAGTLGKLLGTLRVVATDYVTYGGAAVAVFRNLGLALKANGTANLWMVLVAQATINVATATHMTLRFSILQD